MKKLPKLGLFPYSWLFGFLTLGIVFLLDQKLENYTSKILVSLVFPIILFMIAIENILKKRTDSKGRNNQFITRKNSPIYFWLETSGLFIAAIFLLYSTLKHIN